MQPRTRVREECRDEELEQRGSGPFGSGDGRQARGIVNGGPGERARG